MKIEAEGQSHVGMKRRLNEDKYLIRPDFRLYVIADGMGGHRTGEVASQMAVDTLEDYWQKVYSGKSPSFLKPIEKDISENAKHLINSISLANSLIHEAQKKPQYYQMGTTISALLVEEDVIWVSNVGDSPVYIFDNGNLILLSEEHSVGAEQLSMGMDDTFNSTSPLIKNILTRVLGPEEKVEVYIHPIKPEPGDILLMCSDGLTNYMSEQAISTVLGINSIPFGRKVDLLIDGANKGGGGDNISVILLEVLEEGSWNKLKKRFRTG